MEVWFSIQIAWKVSLETNQIHGKREFMDLPHGILSFQGRPRALHMDIHQSLLSHKLVYTGGF